MGSQPDATTVEALLSGARQQLERVTPQAASHLADNGAILIDIRSDTQRDRMASFPVPSSFSETSSSGASIRRAPIAIRPSLSAAAG